LERQRRQNIESHGGIVAVRQRLIPLDRSDEWRAALRDVPHCFAHTWEHCHAMHLSSGLVTYLYQVESEGSMYVCPLAERTWNGSVDVVTPYGFSGFTGRGDRAQLSELWRRFARERGYVSGFITQNPVLGRSPYCAPDEGYQHKSVYVLDLVSSTEQLFARLHTNRKRELRRWDEITGHLVLDQEELTAFLLARYQEFLRSRCATSVFDLAPESLTFLASLDNVLLVGMNDGDGVQAVSMFGYTPDGADYLYNVSRPEGRRFSSALIWYAVQMLKSLGVPSLNLGGGVSEGDGVARFKRRFGGDCLPLTYLKQVYDRTAFVEACLRADADPDDLTGYFPPYRSQ